VVYTYQIVNTSVSNYLINITLTDNVLGAVGTIPGPVAPGATNYLYATNFNVTVSVTNTAVVVGTPAGSNGVSLGVGNVFDDHKALVPSYIREFSSSRRPAALQMARWTTCCPDRRRYTATRSSTSATRI